MVTITETRREAQSELMLEDEDHDGWGPIRPRRSSMPPDLPSDPHEQDTTPVICSPTPDEQQTTP